MELHIAEGPVAVKALVEVQHAVQEADRAVLVHALHIGDTVGEGFAALAPVGRGPGHIAEEHVGGDGVAAGGEVVPAGAGGGIDGIGIGGGGEIHILVRFPVAVAVTRHDAVDLLPQLLIAHPVGHKGVVEFPGGAEVLPEAAVVDDIQAVGHIAQANAAVAGGVVLRASGLAVLAIVHAPLQGGGEQGQGVVEGAHGFPGIDAGALPLAEEIEGRLHRGQDFVHVLHLIEVTRGGAELLRFPAGEGIAVVDGHEESIGDIQIALGAGAAGLGPLVAPHGGLHAAVEAVVPGVLQGDAPLHEGLDDDLVGFKGGHTAGDLGGLDGGLPQLVGGPFVDAQGLGRIVEDQAAGGLEHHVGHGVGGVLAVLIHAAQGHELAGGVARAGLGGPFGPDLVALGHLEIEEIHQLLGILRGDGAAGDVLVVVAAQVLVHPAIADAVELPVHAEGQLIEINALNGVMEIAAGVLHDPVQAVCHLQQFLLPLRIGAGLGLAQGLGGIALGPMDDALADDIHSPIEIVLVNAVAVDALFLQLGHLCQGFLPDGAEALLGGGPEIGNEVAHRGFAVVVGREADGSVAVQLVPIVTGDVLVRDGAHGMGRPEVAGLQQILLILGVDVIGVHAPVADVVCPQLLHEPVEAGLGIEGAAAVAGALPAHDHLVLVDEDGHILKEVAQVLGTLQDTGDLGVRHIELRDQPVAIDIDPRLGGAVFLPDPLHPQGDGFQLVHGFLLPPVALFTRSWRHKSRPGPRW